MTEELGTVEGISRRDMLRRSAILGGGAAMVWAAPSVTTLGARAFGSEGTPRSDFSNFGAIIDCTVDGDTTTYKIQYEVDEGGWVPAATGSGDILGGCIDALGLRTAWDGATPAPAPWDLGVTIHWGTNVTIRTHDDSDCTFAVNGGAASLKQGVCCYAGTVAEDGKSITWYGPFDNQPPCEGGVQA